MADTERVAGTRGSWPARQWWLHPLLLGAFPVLYLFAANLGEQVTIDPLIGPLLIAVGCAVALLALVRALFALVGLDALRAGLVASLVLALFFGYGHVWHSTEASIRSHAPLLAAWALLGILGVVLVVRARADRIRLTTGTLNLAAIVLVIVNAVAIIGFAPRDDSVAVGAGPYAPAGAPRSSAPDIWYLVFDRYGGAPGLAEAYGYDNRPFLRALESRGLTVFEDATANYLKTAHSLVSTLEMAYLDGEALRADAAAPDDWAPLYRVLQGSHAVGRFVHEQGYEYLHLGVRRGSTYTNTTADRTFLYTDHSEFSAVLLDSTLATALGSLTSSQALGGIAEMYRNHSLYQLDVLEQLASEESERPRFIFAHFLLPHPPYVFNADGSWVTTAQAAERSPDEQYLAQVEFTNDRILELLDAIERSSDEPPVIVLQSDEGPFPARYARDEESFTWRDATDAELLQKFSILAAYRVPGAGPGELGLEPTMTPVNTFRAVFNVVFDANLELLPDQNIIFVDQRHLYDLVDVTDRVRAAVPAN